MAVLKNLRNLLILVPLGAGLLSCSWLGVGGDEGWLRDRQGDYLDAQTVSRMQIPENLDNFTMEDLYRIPPEPEGPGDYHATPPAPEAIDTRVRDNVVLQQFGDRSWIVLGATAGQVWPRLLDYWSTEDLPLARQDAGAGVMETQWLPQQEGDTEVRHKYRISVEPGLHAGNSEIYVRHVSDRGESPSDAPGQWPGESDNPQRAEAVLTSISTYLAERTDLYRASSVSLLAGSVEAESKANVLGGSGEPARLELRIDFDRAWSQVAQSLDNANIEILESDRDQRRFRVAFSGEESAEEPGFFSRLFGGGPDEEDLREFTVSVEELEEERIMVHAEPEGGTPANRLREMLIRAINDNLV